MDPAATANILHDLYENHGGYLDSYGTNIVTVIIATMVVALLCSYFYIQSHIQSIVEDWPNQRCKPSIIPFAGYIYKQDPTLSASDATKQNMEYCSQSTLKEITGPAVQPLTFAVQNLATISGEIGGAVDSARGMFDKMRTSLSGISEEIMGRTLNVTIPIQQIVISFKDMMGKVQGTMAAALFMSLGTYDTLKSLMGAMAELIVKILIALAAMIIVMWLLPFTWGMASVMTALFIAVSIPLALMVGFMTDQLHVKMDGFNIPSVPKKMKCFVGSTRLTLADGVTTMSIKDVVVGETILNDGGRVTSKMVVCSRGSVLYDFGSNITVSDTHLVYDCDANKWVRAADHPDAVPTKLCRNPGVLYCINTTTKCIHIDGHIFSDWDELVTNEQMEWYYARGNDQSWDIKLSPDQYVLIGEEGLSTRTLKQVSIFDVLYGGGGTTHKNYVYGVVELEDGGRHLLTNTGEIYIVTGDGCTADGNTKVIGDYNSCLDLILGPDPNSDFSL